MRRAEIETRLIDIGAHSAPARAAAILHGLGFDAEAQARPCASFSGGWRMRVALAGVLFSEPDLLLLDEPTNYLDLEGTLWLYDYLGRYPHTVLIISHDRELLDTAVDHILHLDRGKLALYRGGYTTFARQLAEKQALQAKMKVQAGGRAPASPRLRRPLPGQGVEGAPGAIAAETAREARADRGARRGRDARLRPAGPGAALGAAARRDGEGRGGLRRAHRCLDRLNLTILPDDRIALLGANGNGKSTFCKLIGGRLAPMTGEVRAPAKLDVGLFRPAPARRAAPGRDALRPRRRAHARTRPRRKVRARGGPLRLSRAQRPTRRSRQLSGGEKARLLMGLAAFDGPHLLILDEPTNHLDIDSRAALMEAINDYEGAVILVSHDRFLIEACADRLWLVADGTVKPFDGDMDDYRRLVLAGRARRPAHRSSARAGALLPHRRSPRRGRAPRRARAAAQAAGGGRGPYRASSPPRSPRSTRRSLTAPPSGPIPPRRGNSPRSAPKRPKRSPAPRRIGWR